MKKSWLILILFFSFSLLQAENTNFSKGLEKLKSNIVIQPNQKAKLDNSEEYWDIDTLITYHSLGEPSSRTIKKYDIKGNMIEELKQFYNGFNTPNWRLNQVRYMTYDDQNRLVTEKLEYASQYSEDRFYEYEYDLEIDDIIYDRIIKFYYKTGGSFKLDHTLYTSTSYDGGEKTVTDRREYTSQNIDTSKLIEIYDRNDNLLSRVQQISRPQGFHNEMGTFYEYDSQNRVTRKTSKSWHIVTQEEYIDRFYIYTYHQGNQLAQECYVSNYRSSNDSQVFITKYTYDENDNLSSEIEYYKEYDELFDDFSAPSYPYAGFDLRNKIDYVFENGYLAEEVHSRVFYDDWTDEYYIDYEYRCVYEYDSKGNMLTKFEQTWDLYYDEYADEWSYAAATKTHYVYDDFGNSIYSWYERYSYNDGGGGEVSTPRKPKRLDAQTKKSALQNDDDGWSRESADLDIIVGGQTLMTLDNVYDYDASFVDRNNIVYINAKEGHKGAAYFDGQTVIKTAANPPAFTNTLTMAAWVKADNLTGNKTIASWQCGAANEASLKLEGSQLVFRTWENATSSTLAVGSNKFLLADTWYHVAVTLDEGLAKLYINGEDVTGTSNDVFTDLGAAVHFAVGSSPEGNTDTFKGYIDNLSLWSEAKTASQIPTLFKELIGDEDNLELALNFDHSLSVLPTDTDVQFEDIEPEYIMLDSYAAVFDGTDHTLTLETPAPYGDSFTISGWFKAEEGDVRTIASWANASAFNSFQLGADNKLYYTQDKNGSAQTAVSEKSIENDIWYHIALVKNNSTVKFYLNGSEDVSVANNINTNQTSDNFNIGAVNQNGTTTQHWKGEMDNLCFYTEARTATEVLEDFQYGPDLAAESLWAYWNFDDKNEIVVDAKNNHHITTGSKDMNKSILIYSNINMENELLRDRTDHEVHVVGKNTHLHINKDFYDNDLTIYPGNKLTVHRRIEFSPRSLRLKSSEDGPATLLAMQNTETTMELYTKNNQPLTIGVPFRNTSSNTGLDKLMYYDYWYEEWVETSNASFYNVVMAIPKEDTDKISFTGNINSGVYYERIYGDDYGYELLLNPYPSYITWEDFYAHSKRIEGNIWQSIYKNENQVIGVYNGEVGTHGAGNTIVPFQSFWVRNESSYEEGEVELNDNIRSHYDEAIHSNKMLRAPQEQYPFTRIVVSDGTLDDETILYFKEEHSDLWDEKDAGKMMMDNDNPEIWTMLYSEPLAINAMEAVPYHIEMPLGFSTNKAGDFTLRATDFKGFETGDMFMLFDKEADNKATNLATRTYSFTSDVTNTIDRFTFKITPAYPTGDKEFELSNYVFVYAQTDCIIINLKQEIENAQAEIYSINGQKLASHKLNTNQTTLPARLPSGVYLVVVENMGEKATKRVIVK